MGRGGKHIFRRWEEDLRKEIRRESEPGEKPCEWEG